MRTDEIMRCVRGGLPGTVDNPHVSRAIKACVGQQSGVLLFKTPFLSSVDREVDCD